MKTPKITVQEVNGFVHVSCDNSVALLLSGIIHELQASFINTPNPGVLVMENFANSIIHRYEQTKEIDFHAKPISVYKELNKNIITDTYKYFLRDLNYEH